MKAKHFNNVVREPLLSIPLVHVAPPYLHILLGIVKKHHDIIESVYNQIDKDITHVNAELFKEMPAVSTEFDSFFYSYKSLIEKKIEIEGLISFNDLENRDVSELYDKLEEVTDEIEQVLNSYPGYKGPLCSQLDHVLESNKIIRQAFHANSFIGNHCNKYLKINSSGL